MTTPDLGGSQSTATASPASRSGDSDGRGGEGEGEGDELSYFGLPHGLDVLQLSQLLMDQTPVPFLVPPLPNPSFHLANGGFNPFIMVGFSQSLLAKMPTFRC